MSDENKDPQKKEMEVVTGDGKDLDISPVYDHIIINKPLRSNQKKNVIIPKEEKNKKK